MEEALVSCILATRNRPQFFRQALRCYLAQTYQPSELIVVDDGERPVGELCAGLPRVRYLRLRRPTPLGVKLNLGIEQANGTILQKMDDDDYYHPDFLRVAVSHLSAGRCRSVVAWDCFLVLLAGQKRLRFSGHGWSAGGTLCFARRLWQRAGFRELPRAVDSWFLRDHDYRVAPVCAPEYYILVRHGANTWTRMDDQETDDYIRELPAYPKPLHKLVDARARRFYAGLKYRRA